MHNGSENSRGINVPIEENILSAAIGYVAGGKAPIIAKVLSSIFYGSYTAAEWMDVTFAAILVLSFFAILVVYSAGYKPHIRQIGIAFTVGILTALFEYIDYLVPERLGQSLLPLYRTFFFFLGAAAILFLPMILPRLGWIIDGEKLPSIMSLVMGLSVACLLAGVGIYCLIRLVGIDVHWKIKPMTFNTIYVPYVALMFLPSWSGLAWRKRNLFLMSIWYVCFGLLGVTYSGIYGALFHDRGSATLPLTWEWEFFGGFSTYCFALVGCYAVCTIVMRRKNKLVWIVLPVSMGLGAAMAAWFFAALLNLEKMRSFAGVHFGNGLLIGIILVIFRMAAAKLIPRMSERKSIRS